MYVLTRDGKNAIAGVGSLLLLWMLCFVLSFLLFHLLNEFVPASPPRKQA